MAKFVVASKKSGFVKGFTFEEYKKQRNEIPLFDDSEDSFTRLHSVEAENLETAVAISIAEMLNENRVIDQLIEEYIEEHSYGDSGVIDREVKFLDELLSRYSERGRKQLAEDLIDKDNID